jgi:predicted Holliday junction resolvase-like endonuclease
MTGATWAGPALTALSILTTILITVASTMWALRGRFETVKDDLREEFKKGDDQVRREVGETVRAVKEHGEQTEFWVRDNVITKLHSLEISVTRGEARNEAVLESLDRFGHVIDTMDKKNEARFDRLENKIDKMPLRAGS